MNNEIKKYDFIDALRGFAILGVLMIHTHHWVKPSSTLLQLICANGALGVQLFFVVSAMTLFTSIHSRSTKDRFPLRSFFIRRFFRIAPMFYVGIVLYSITEGLAPNYWVPDGKQWWFIPLTIFFMHGWLPDTITAVVPGGWTIAAEMMFYILVPYLYKRLKNIETSFLYFLIFLVVAKIFSVLAFDFWMGYYPAEQEYIVSSFIYFSFLSQLPVFCVGIMTYHVFMKYEHIKDRRLGSFLLLCVLVLWCVLLKVETYKNLFPPYVLYGITFGMFAMALHFNPVKICVNAFFQWLGRISFSIYILHFEVINLLKTKFFYEGFILEGNLGFWCALLVVVFLSAAVAHLTYSFIEKPGINLGKSLIDRLNKNFK